MTILIVVNTILFASISMLHAYWALGGSVGKFAVLPSRSDGSLLFKPGIFSTWVVAVGLLIFAVVTLGNLSMQNWIDSNYVRSGTGFIAAIFLLRAIGDFKFIGFFKRINGTAFARNDTRIYSPLSFTMGIISLTIAVRPF